MNKIKIGSLISFFKRIKRKGFVFFLGEIKFLTMHQLKSMIHSKFSTLPLSYNIGISSICNLDCKYCTRSSYKKNGLTTLSKIKRLVKQIPQFSIITIVDLGEPFLHKDIVKILYEFKRKNNRIHLFTNGSLLPRQIAEILRHCDRLSVSVDSVDKERVRSLRTNTNLDQIKNVLASISEIKERKKIKNCELSFNVTISLYNYFEIKKILYFLKEVRFERVIFNLIEDWGFVDEEREKVFQIKNKIVPILQQAVEYCRKNKIVIDNYFNKDQIDKLFKEKQPYSQCRWVDDCVVINWKGDVVPCCLRRDYRIFTLGNVYKEDLKNILSSSKVIYFRQNKDKQFICKNCNWYF